MLFCCMSVLSLQNLGPPIGAVSSLSDCVCGNVHSPDKDLGTNGCCIVAYDFNYHSNTEHIWEQQYQVNL